MSVSNRNLHEPFIRVRLVRFSDGTHVQTLSELKLLIETADPGEST